MGVLSEADIVVKARRNGPRNRLLRLAPRARRRLEDKISAETVGEAMTVTSGDDRSDSGRYTRPLEAMVSENVNRLPVVEKGKLVGILTRADIVRAFTRTTPSSSTRSATTSCAGRSGSSPGASRSTVVDGQVTLRGEVETEAEMEMLPNFVSRVPGVISVDADLASRETRAA